MILRFVLVLLLSLNVALAADTLTKEQLPLSDTNVLTLERPAQFQLKLVQDPEDSSRPAIRLSVTGPDGNNRVIFKIFAGKLAGAGPESQADLAAALQKLGAAYMAGSVEQTNEMHDLKLSQPGSRGAYCSYTDARLVGAALTPPGEYRVITLALVRINDYLFTIQGGSDDKHGVDYLAAIGILNTLKVESKAPDKSAKPQ